MDINLQGAMYIILSNLLNQGTLKEDISQSYISNSRVLVYHEQDPEHDSSPIIITTTVIIDNI